MKIEQLKQIKAGDRVQFRAITRWSGDVVWRIVKRVERDEGFWCGVEVRYGGWSNFLVKWSEITGVEKRETKQ